MKYFWVVDMECKVEAENKSDIPELMGYDSEKDFIADNGGSYPQIVEITLDDYEEDCDGLDVY